MDLTSGARLALCTAALVALAAPRGVRADRRYYGETYNAATAPKGALDVELWGTLNEPRAGGTRSADYALELETGITDRWDAAIYGLFVQESGSSFQFQGLKLESRFRLSDPGQWFVDPVLYLELKKEFIGDEAFAVEEKVILGKDVGPVNLSLNLSAEQEIVGGDTTLEWGYAFGTSYELVPAFRLGAEVFGTVANEAQAGGGKSLVSQAWAGPAISVAASRVWLVLAAGWGLTEESDRVRVRAILAFQF